MKNSLMIFVFMFPLIAEGDGKKDWDNTRFYNLKGGLSYEISSGTGFFINNNYIITNEHVVENCKNIAVRGAISPNLVKLVAINKSKDLALLYSPSPSAKFAYLRNNQGLKYKDPLFVVGYPLDYGKSGKFLIRQAELLSLNKAGNEKGNFDNIEFTNIVEHGNSGGPLLDANNNVIGVVRAKKSYYDISNPAVIHNTTGVALTVKDLVSFLTANNVNYTTAPTYNITTNYDIATPAKGYIVNIHCVKDAINTTAAK